jgi:microcystin-dependent protein
MTQPYVGEIRLFPYVRGAPSDWQICDGSLLQISQYETLYTLLGTTYGGDGQTTFAVPDLRGRVAVHQGTGNGLSTYPLGQVAGSEQVTLTSQQMPQHTHFVLASTQAATQTAPANNILAAAFTNDAFYAVNLGGATTQNLIGTTVGMDGNNLPHENCAPTLALNYCIALYGIYPTQS